MSNKKSNYPTNQQPNLERGEMSSLVEKMDVLRNLPDFDHRDPVALEERLQTYFDFCIENDLRPTVDGLSLACGVSRVTLWQWQQQGGQRGRLIENSKQLLAALLEQWAVCGRVNPATAIFLQKNHFGYRDCVDLVAVPATNKLDSLESRDSIIRRLQSTQDLSGNEPSVAGLLEELGNDHDCV